MGLPEVFYRLPGLFHGLLRIFYISSTALLSVFYASSMALLRGFYYFAGNAVFAVFDEFPSKHL
jgi:hypothetical protein